MHFRNRISRIARCLLAFQIVFLFAAHPLQAEDTSELKTDPINQKEISDLQKPEGTVGRAYYYRKSLKNKKTSSGAIYCPHKLTAAHPTLPLGKKVKVINIGNKKSVVVTVNDRRRKHHFEFIDLSQAAARALGFFGKGMAMVQIIPFEE